MRSPRRAAWHPGDRPGRLGTAVVAATHPKPAETTRSGGHSRQPGGGEDNMRDVKLVRLSDDGTHVVLTHEGTGEEFALRIDDRLRGAVVSDRARQGSLPRERQSRLRPKEIQARLRAGESSESIAAAAGVPLER